MKKLSFSILVSSSLIYHIYGSDYVVISNKTMPSISKTQLKAIFLKKLTIVNDMKMVPINLNPRDTLRQSFEKKILKMNFIRLKNYWSQQHYLGHRPPLNLHSQESVKAFVKKVDGAIGYIDAKNIDNELKELYRWSR